MVSPDGVAPSQMVGVSASVNLPLHHKVQKFSSGTGSPRWSRQKGCKVVVVWCGGAKFHACKHAQTHTVFAYPAYYSRITHKTQRTICLRTEDVIVCVHVLVRGASENVFG